MNHLLDRRVFFGLLFLLVTILVLALVWPYLNVIFFSLTVVVILRPVYTRIYEIKWVKSKGLATTLTIIAFALLIAIPVSLLVLLTVSQLKQLSADFSLEGFVLEDFLNDLLDEMDRLPLLSRVEFDQQSFLQTINNALGQAISWLINTIVSIGASFPNLLITLFLFVGFLVTLLPAVDGLIGLERQLVPLESSIVDAYLTKTRLMIQSMFLGIFVLSFIQGAAMGVFYIVAGLPYAALWTMLSIAFSVLPLVGISLIVLPMSIVLILSGNVTSALIVLVGFYGFANWIDNLLRPKLVPKEAHLHPMLLILSVFGGIALSGMLGVIYGPVIMIVFVTTIDVYRTYFLGIEGPGEAKAEAALPS